MEDHTLLRRDVEIKHLPLCTVSFVKPDIVIGTRLALFHLFATRTLWVRIKLVASDNAVEQKVMSIRWP